MLQTAIAADTATRLTADRSRDYDLIRRAIAFLTWSWTEQPSLDALAAHLGLNVRTLQRRLEGEGAVFANLLTQVRRDLAERYLADEACSLTQAAALLGYGQLSSFTRWFTTEFHASPSAWRA